jgi:DNA-binding NtrC family response regulator
MSTKTILIAEDDNLLRNLYGKALRSLNHTLLFAESCASTLEQLAEHVPDMIVLDMTMTDGSSIPVLESMQSDPRFDNTRIIVVTGNRQYEQRVANFNIEQFLHKPVSARSLTELVSRILQ